MENLMRVLLLALMFIPTVCFGLSAENEELIGFDRGGGRIKIEFLSDPVAWNGNNFLYSDRNNKNYKYCWSTAETIKDARTSFTLQCSSKENTKPNVVYKNQPDSGGEFDRAIEMFRKRWGPMDGAILIYYKCVIGCDKNVAPLIFNLTHGDEEN